MLHLSVTVGHHSANKALNILTLRSILAKPNALDALSLASWKSSLSERLVSITERLQEKKKIGINAYINISSSENKKNIHTHIGPYD